jgi:hypothetical protein
VKRLVLLAVAGIAAVGAGASLVILSITESWTSGSTTAPSEMAEVRRAEESAAPGEPRTVIQPEQPAQPGFRRLQLPPRIAARDVTAPIAECLRSHPTSAGGGAVLTLELEALASGGLRIVAAPVAAWGNASRALVACAQQVLPGRTVAVGEYPPGERFRARYDLESAAAAPPTQEPPVATALPARQPARRGPGGGRR